MNRNKTMKLANAGMIAALYVVLSVAGCIMGVWCGMRLAALCGFEKAGD